MATDPEFMRKKYRELMLGVILMDTLMQEEAEAKELGITVDELMDRRSQELLKQDKPHSPPGSINP